MGEAWESRLVKEYACEPVFLRTGRDDVVNIYNKYEVEKAAGSISLLFLQVPVCERIVWCVINNSVSIFIVLVKAFFPQFACFFFF
jgi:hypothetical protein